MGFSSMLNPNFVGLRYMNQSYTSRDGLFNNSPWIDENFNTVQVWARIPVAKNVQVSALIPYHFHNRELTSGEQNIKGLGDISILGFYTIYQTKKILWFFASVASGRWNQSTNWKIQFPEQRKRKS